MQVLQFSNLFVHYKFTMMKSIILLFCALVAVQVNSTVIPKKQVQDIADEARRQLEELKSIIEGDILASHDDLGNLKSDFLTNSDTVIKNGAVSLQQEHETVIAQVLSLKELAHSANKDISSCLEHREDALNRLSSIYSMEMFRCVQTIDKEAGRIADSAKSIIGLNINKVHDLQHELNQCGDSLLCIQPVLTEIQLDMIRLPQKIKTEVTATSSQLTTLKLSIQQCSDVKVSEYSSNANSILGDITDCVNRII